MKRFLVLLAFCGSAHAEFQSGNDLWTKLNSNNHSYEMYAMGYIAGAYDVGAGTNHCVPTGVTLGQIQDIVKDTLRILPEKRHLSADSFVSFAVRNAFPCKQNSNDRMNNL